jgi:putative ABC transport system substrate-binding protein
LSKINLSVNRAAVQCERPDGIFVPEDPFFNSRRLQLSLLAMRHAVPATYSQREYAEVGGLMTYGSEST